MAMDEFYCPMLTIPQGKRIQCPRRRGRCLRGRICRLLPVDAFLGQEYSTPRLIQWLESIELEFEDLSHKSY
jgi:hypothetical protein